MLVRQNSSQLSRAEKGGRSNKWISAGVTSPAYVLLAARGQAADRPMDATGSKSTRVLRPCSARLVSCSGAQTPPRVRARSRAAAPHLPSTDDDGAPPYRFAFALRIRWMPRYGNLAMPGVGNKCVPGCPRCQVATLASPPYTIVSTRGVRC